MKIFNQEPSLIEVELENNARQLDDKIKQHQAYQCARMLADGVDWNVGAINGCIENPKTHEKWTYDGGELAVGNDYTGKYSSTALKSACQELHTLAKTKPGKLGADMAILATNSGLKGAELTEYFKQFNFTPPPFKGDQPTKGM